jgi:hypothetical protein
MLINNTTHGHTYVIIALFFPVATHGYLPIINYDRGSINSGWLRQRKSPNSLLGLDSRCKLAS